jgi:hypothetical protein
MPATPFTSAAADLMRTLTPATLATRVAFSGWKRPWLPDYRLRASAGAATRVYGVNAPGLMRGLDAGKITLASGAAAADNATPFTYTPTPAITLPVTADLTNADALLDAIAIWYPKDKRGDAQWIRRVEYGGSALTDNLPWWKVASTGTITTAKGYAAAKHVDWTVNDMIEIYVPAAADIALLKTFAAAGEDVVKAMDFMAAGYSTAVGNVVLQRILL